MMVELEFGWAADVESSAQYVPRCDGLVVCVGTMMAAVNAHGASDSKNVGVPARMGCVGRIYRICGCTLHLKACVGLGTHTTHSNVNIGCLV